MSLERFDPRLLTGIVLGGGRSRRLGKAPPKPLLPLGGKLMLARVADVLKQVCHESILVVRPGQDDDVPDLGLALGMHVVADAGGYSGPLAALSAGLNVATTPLAFVVGADHPFLSRGLILEMSRRSVIAIGGREETSFANGAAVVINDGNYLNPLHAIYPVAIWRRLTAEALEAGIRSPRLLLDRAIAGIGPDVEIMMPDEVERVDPQLMSLLDIDTLEDLGIAKRIIELQIHKVRPDLRRSGI